MGRHSAREIWDEAKHRRGHGGRFVVVDHADYPPIRTLAAIRAWMKAGEPKTRTVSRLRATNAKSAYEQEFGTSWPGSTLKRKSKRKPKGKPTARTARSLMSKG